MIMILSAFGLLAVWHFLHSCAVASSHVTLGRATPAQYCPWKMWCFNSRVDPTVAHLTLRHSKTDIFGVGVTIHLGRTGDSLCPVSSLLAYLSRRPSSPGPLFLLQSGQPLSKQVLVSTVHDALGSAGVDVGRFNGHSFRIGAATAAAQAGLPDSTIQQLGRWRSSAFTRYLRPPVQSIARLSQRLLHPTHSDN